MRRAEPVVVIDAGHGGEDAAQSSPDGVLEKGLNLEECAETRIASAAICGGKDSDAPLETGHSALYGWVQRHCGEEGL